RRPGIADREPEDVAPVELRVVDEDLTRRVHAFEQPFVLIVRALAAEDDEREAARRHDLPARRLLDPAGEEPRESDVLAHDGAQPLRSVAAEHSPELERAKAAPERRPVLRERVGLVRRSALL